MRKVTFANHKYYTIPKADLVVDDEMNLSYKDKPLDVKWLPLQKGVFESIIHKQHDFELWITVRSGKITYFGFYPPEKRDAAFEKQKKFFRKYAETVENCGQLTDEHWRKMYVCNVKFEEKDIAKEAGFKWNPDQKVWWTTDEQIANSVSPDLITESLRII